MIGFVDRFIRGNEYTWLWFVSTVVFGAAQMILTVLISLNQEHIDVLRLYRMIDLIAWGITMCVSNLNLVVGKRFDLQKGVLLGFSFGVLFALTVCLVIVQLMKETFIFFDLSVHFIVAGSIFLSFCANRYVFAIIKKGP